MIWVFVIIQRLNPLFEGDFLTFIPTQEQNHDYSELEIKLMQILGFSYFILQMRYSKYIYSVMPSEDTVYKLAKEIDKSIIDKFKGFTLTLSQLKKVTPMNFARTKYVFDSFFYALTTKGTIEYSYINSYLLTVDDAGKMLKVSRPTINKYGKNGQLEMLHTTKHNKIPYHAVEIWKDTEFLIKTQMLHDAFVIRNNPLRQQLEDIMVIIKEFKEMYDDKPFEVVYKDIIEGKIPWDAVDSISDYSEWELLLEDLNEIKAELGI